MQDFLEEVETRLESRCNVDTTKGKGSGHTWTDKEHKAHRARVARAF